MGYLLGLDAGTTGITAVLYTTELEPVRRAYREFPQHFPASGWVEHDADEIRAALQAALSEVLAGTDASIAGIGITNQRETIFALDRNTGRAFGRGIVWQDRRTARRCQELTAQGKGDLIRARTGLVLDPYFSASKMEWLLREREGVAQAAQQGSLVFATVDSLVLQALSGDSTWRTDPTNACRTMLFDIDRRVWDNELADIFGVPPACLPEVCPSKGFFGTAHLPGRRSAPILGMAGDQQAALLGQRCWTEGDFKITYGTGCFLVLNTGAKRIEPKGGLLTTLAIDAAGETCYAIEGSIFAGGAVVQWLRDGLGILEQASDSEALARQVPDTGGVVLIPAFAGLGAPHWAPDARAALLGMTRGTHKAHIARAALESIAWQCADVVDLLRRSTGFAVRVLKVDGGAVQNNLLLQMQADFAGAEVWRAQDIESTARGAALLAGLGAGVVEVGAKAETATPVGDRFRPEASADQVAAQHKRWKDGLRCVLDQAAREG